MQSWNVWASAHRHHAHTRCGCAPSHNNSKNNNGSNGCGIANELGTLQRRTAHISTRVPPSPRIPAPQHLPHPLLCPPHPAALQRHQLYAQLQFTSAFRTRCIFIYTPRACHRMPCTASPSHICKPLLCHLLSTFDISAGHPLSPFPRPVLSRLQQSTVENIVIHPAPLRLLPVLLGCRALVRPLAITLLFLA